MKIIGAKWVVKYEAEFPKWNDSDKFLFDGVRIDLIFLIEILSSSYLQ